MFDIAIVYRVAPTNTHQARLISAWSVLELALRAIFIV